MTSRNRRNSSYQPACETSIARAMGFITREVLCLFLSLERVRMRKHEQEKYRGGLIVLRPPSAFFAPNATKSWFSSLSRACPGMWRATRHSTIASTSGAVHLWPAVAELPLSPPCRRRASHVTILLKFVWFCLLSSRTSPGRPVSCVFRFRVCLRRSVSITVLLRVVQLLLLPSEQNKATVRGRGGGRFSRPDLSHSHDESLRTSLSTGENIVGDCFSRSIVACHSITDSNRKMKTLRKDLDRKRNREVTCASEPDALKNDYAKCDPPSWGPQRKTKTKNSIARCHP